MKGWLLCSKHKLLNQSWFNFSPASVDGVPILNDHWSNVFNLLEPDAVRQAKLISGRYGGEGSTVSSYTRHCPDAGPTLKQHSDSIIRDFLGCYPFSVTSHSMRLWEVWNVYLGARASSPAPKSGTTLHGSSPSGLRQWGALCLHHSKHKPFA